MGIFTFIMHKYNNQFVSVDDMATQLASIINSKLNDIKTVNVPILGTITLDLNYRLSTDGFSYSTDRPYSTNPHFNVADEWNDDGVGYVILSIDAIE